MNSFFNLLIFITIPLNLISQASTENIEIKAIKESFVDYLNHDPNSIASFSNTGEFYKITKDFFSLNFASITDSFSIEKREALLRKIDSTSDTITELMKSRKIQVFISDTLFAYKYEPTKYFDLRIEKDWNEEYNSFLMDFEQNYLHIFDTALEKEYISLLRKQIFQEKKDTIINLNILNKSYYLFETIDSPCKDSNYCVNGVKIYRPVFNKSFDKGCYLYASKCRAGICRRFIFIKKTNGRWQFVDDYSDWKIGKKYE